MKSVNSFSRHLQCGTGTQVNTNKEWEGGFADDSGHGDLAAGWVRQTGNQAVTRRGAREGSIMLLLVGAPCARKANSRRGWALPWSKPGKKLATARVGARVPRC